MASNAPQSSSLEDTTDRLRRAQKAGRLGTWDWDVRTNVLIWDGVETVHGLPEGSFGGSFDAYLADIHPEDRDRVLATIANAREAGSDFEMEYRIVLPDSSVRSVSGRGTSFIGPDGTTSRMAGTCQDVTERKRAEQQKEDLLAFASHELRNPLTSILGFSRLLERRLTQAGETLDEDGIEAIRTISAESQRMAEILETFLDLGRSESSQLEVNLEAVDLIEVLTNQIERLKAKHEEAEVHTELSSDKLVLDSDLRRLRQVFSNLLDNAVKYGGSPPIISVSAEVVNGWAHVRVRDNGGGISADDRQHLFGRFYRGSASTGQRKGLGIGLYLSRQLVQRLGGTLDLDSPPGSPAVFLLRLPLNQ